MIIIPRAPFFCLFVVEPVSRSRPKSPYLAPRVVTARAVQRVNVCRTIVESFSRMHASARSQCRTTDDLTPRSAEVSPTLASRAVAANATQRVISCRVHHLSRIALLYVPARLGAGRPSRRPWT